MLYTLTIYRFFLFHFFCTISIFLKLLLFDSTSAHERTRHSNPKGNHFRSLRFSDLLKISAPFSVCIIWNSNFAQYLQTVWEPTIFFQELEIKGKKNQKLHWLGYSILSKYKDGREQLSDLDVTNLNNYPTMVFVPVNSYTTETFQPLIWWDKVKKENLFIDTSHRYKLWEYNNKRTSTICIGMSETWWF